MTDWFARFWRRKTPDKTDQYLNLALQMLCEFGENWGKPIEARFEEQTPELTATARLQIIANAIEAQKSGYNLVCDLAELQGDDVSIDEWNSRISRSFPWLSESSRNRLFSQGMYYSRCK